jgi:hypothetical protein
MVRGFVELGNSVSEPQRRSEIIGSEGDVWNTTPMVAQWFRGSRGTG